MVYSDDRLISVKKGKINTRQDNSWDVAHGLIRRVEPFFSDADNKELTSRLIDKLGRPANCRCIRLYKCTGSVVLSDPYHFSRTIYVWRKVVFVCNICAEDDWHVLPLW